MKFLRIAFFYRAPPEAASVPGVLFLVFGTLTLKSYVKVDWEACITSVIKSFKKYLTEACLEPTQASLKDQLFSQKKFIVDVRLGSKFISL